MVRAERLQSLAYLRRWVGELKGGKGTWAAAVWLDEALHIPTSFDLAGLSHCNGGKMLASRTAILFLEITTTLPAAPTFAIHSGASGGARGSRGPDNSASTLVYRAKDMVV